MCLGVDGINGKGTGIVMRSAEVYHEQDGFVAGFHTCKHIAVLVVASPVRMAEEEEITKE